LLRSTNLMGLSPRAVAAASAVTTLLWVTADSVAPCHAACTQQQTQRRTGQQCTQAYSNHIRPRPTGEFGVVRWCSSAADYTCKQRLAECLIAVTSCRCGESNAAPASCTSVWWCTGSSAPSRVARRHSGNKRFRLSRAGPTGRLLPCLSVVNTVLPPTRLTSLACHGAGVLARHAAFLASILPHSPLPSRGLAGA
jgi:hypothetical protein